MKLIFSIVLLTGTVFAQTPAPKSPPTLPVTAQVALKAEVQKSKDITTEQQQLQQEVNAIQQELAKQFPGYHLSLQTLVMEADAPKTVKVEPKK